MSEGVEVRLVRVETAFDAHQKDCIADRMRTVTDIDYVRKGLHDLRNHVQEGAARAHSRIDEGHKMVAKVEGEMAVVRQEMRGIADAAAAAVRNAVVEAKLGQANSKVWSMVQGIGFLLALAGLAVEIVKSH